MDLQDIQLTEADFDMLIEGLDALPDKGSGGRILAELMGGIMAKDDPRMQAGVDKILGKNDAKKEAQKKQLNEDITLLKSKLILLKRYLITNGALKTTNKILGNDK